MSTRSYASSRRSHRSRPAAKRAAAGALESLRAELEQERTLRQALERELGDLRVEVADLQATLERIAARLASLTRTRPAAPEPETPTGARLIELPREFAETGTSYWLRRCEGFEVVTADDSIGTVAAVRFERRHDRPDRLIVMTDGFRSRLLDVPVELVAEIVQDEELVVLSGDPRTANRRG
jgi:hypothetical protein